MKKKRVKSLLSLLIVLPALLFFACPDPTEEPSGEGSGGGNGGSESITVDPVTDLSAAAGDGTVELTWTLPSTSFDKIVIVYDGGKSLEITDRTQPYAYIEGLQNGTEYTFSVTVWKGSVSSKPTEVKATPLAGASATVPVIFHSNPPADSGVEATAAGQNIPIGKETALRANTFEIPLYRFEGWATAADGEKVYDDEAMVTINKRLELWAVWTFDPTLDSVTVELPKFVVGSSSVTVSETLDPPNAWVKSVSVTASPNNAEFVYTRDTRLLTIPSNGTTEAVDYTLTFTYTTIDDEGNDATKSWSDSIKVYPDKYVIRNEKLYKPVTEYVDFTSTTNIQVENEAGVRKTTNGLELDVSELVADGGVTTKVTFKNIKNGEADTNGWLMELTVNYSDASNVLGIIQFAGGNGGAPWFWLLRNNYENSIGGGTAFSVGANRSGANTRYTVPSDDPFTLGYLFDGADKTNNDNPVSFFFNGEYRPLELTEDQPITAPTLGDTFQLIFAREQSGSDAGVMTIQKVVFYQPVVTAAAN